MGRMSSTEPPAPESAAPGFWGCRALRPDGTIAAFFGADSPLHPDRTRISLPEVEARDAVGGDMTCAVHFDERNQPQLIEIMPRLAPKAPALWFAELAEPDASPPAGNLLAFVGHGVEKGRLLDRDALRRVPVQTVDQLGAVRWYPGTGEIDQLYVAPHARRQNVATAMLVAVSTLEAARDGRSMWGDGQRTADGDRLLKAHPTWSHRAGELTHLMPPMTPMDERLEQ